MAVDTPFFVIGHKRGGTTLLRLMLNKHSRLVLPPESHFMLQLTDQLPLQGALTKAQLSRALHLIASEKRFSTWQVSREQLIQEAEKQPLTDLRSVIEMVFDLQTGPSGKPRWGEKTPEYVDILPQLCQMFPEAVFIVTTRDGRDVSNSLNRVGWEGWTAYQRAKYWSRTVQNMQLLRAEGIKSHFLKYEDLVLDTEATLRGICTSLGEAFEPAMMNFHQDYSKNITEQEKKSGVHEKLGRGPQKDDVGRWRTQSKPSAIFLFEAIASREMQLAGYSFEFYNPDSIVHRTTKVVYSVFGVLVSFLYRMYHGIFSRGLKGNLRKSSIYRTIRGWVRKT